MEDNSQDYLQNNLQNITIKSLSKLSLDDNNIIKFECNLNKNNGIFDSLSHQIYYNKLYNFVNNYCLININNAPYICNKCNKNLGYKDYLYYNGDKKYIITENYYHNVKEHDQQINEILQSLFSLQ
jgi:hypothetical protein